MGDDVQARRWSREYRNLLIREELAGRFRLPGASGGFRATLRPNSSSSSSLQ